MENLELKTINTNVSNEIIKGQLISKESGFFVTQNNKLYKITSDTTSELVNTPDSIKIQNLVFKNANEGLVIGIPTNLASKPDHTLSQKTLLGIVLAVLIIIIVLLYLGFKKWKLKFLYFLIPFILIITTLIMLPSDDAKNEKLYFGDGSHYLSDNKPFDGLSAFTKDGGKTWKTIPVPTNFELTGAIYLNGNYYITSFASKDHLDGDVWRINPTNNKTATSSFASKRALNGLTIYEGNKILAYGNERVTSFSSDSKMVITKGEAFIFDEKIENLTPLDIEGINQITSLSVLPNNDIWAITSDKKTYHYSDNKWQVKNIASITDAYKIEFLNNEIGFILNKNGQLKYTENSGETWSDYQLKEDVKVLEIKKGEDSIELFGTKGFIGLISYKSDDSIN